VIKAFTKRFSLDALSRIITFILNILIARKLLVSDFGLLTYALSAANLLYVFTEMGVSTYLLKEVGKNPEKISDLWREAIFIKLALSFLVFASALLFLGHLWPWSRPWIFLAALGWMFGNSLVDLYQTFCNAMHDFYIAAKIVIASRFLLVSAVALLFLTDRVSITNVILVYLLGSTAGALLSGFVFARHVKSTDKPFDFKDSIELFWRAFPLGIANIFGMAYFRIDTIILTWIRGSAETGIYGAAFRVYEMVFAVPSALMVVATPMLSKALQEGKVKLLRTVKTVLLISAVISSAWLIAGYFGAEKIISMLFGERYAQSGSVLQILVIANTAAFFSTIFTYMMAVVDKQNRHALNQGITLAISLLLNFILIYRYGALGAAWAVLLTQVTILALSLVTYGKRIKTI